MNSLDTGSENMPDEEIMKIIRGELPYLKENFGVKKIGLFGSFARGNAGSDSDVDILAEFERPIGFRFMDFAEYRRSARFSPARPT